MRAHYPQYRLGNGACNSALFDNACFAASRRADQAGVAKTPEACSPLRETSNGTWRTDGASVTYIGR